MTTKPIPMKVEGLYEIIPLKKFRKTPGVSFDILPGDTFDHVAGFDRVIHEKGAISPGPVGNVERPWYMHPHQDDNLLVLHGVRYVDIYSVGHGRIESFEVHPDKVVQDGEVVFDAPAMLVWPSGVFHRIISDEETGSASLNLAVRTNGFDISDNFSIYDLDPATGEYHVIREGHLDQFE